jgi:hypothetical protein
VAGQSGGVDITSPAVDVAHRSEVAVVEALAYRLGMQFQRPGKPVDGRRQLGPLLRILRLAAK